MRSYSASLSTVLPKLVVPKYVVNHGFMPGCLPSTSVDTAKETIYRASPFSAGVGLARWSHFIP